MLVISPWPAGIARPPGPRGAVPTDLNSVISSAVRRPMYPARDQVRKISLDAIPRDDAPRDRVDEVPGFRQRPLERIDEDARATHGVVVRLARGGREAADEVNERAGLEPYSRRPTALGWSLRSSTMSAARTDSSSAGAAQTVTCGLTISRMASIVAATRSGRRPQTSIRSMGRATACAAAIQGASAPVPTTVRRELSARERYFEARAEAAAVRIRVTIVPSSTATGVPSRENATTAAWTVGRPRSAFSGM